MGSLVHIHPTPISQLPLRASPSCTGCIHSGMHRRASVGDVSPDSLSVCTHPDVIVVKAQYGPLALGRPRDGPKLSASDLPPRAISTGMPPEQPMSILDADGRQRQAIHPTPGADFNPARGHLRFTPPPR